MMQDQVNNAAIKGMLRQKPWMELNLSACASCGICADSCFLYRHRPDPRNMPLYKALYSLGVMFKKGDGPTRRMLEEMSDLIYGRCVMCGRCYCPLGIDIAGMISWARAICRSQGVYERYDLDPMGNASRSDGT
jgi:ferredoxin